MTRPIISGYLLSPEGRVGRSAYFLVVFGFLLLCGTISLFLHLHNPIPALQIPLAFFNVFTFVYICVILSIKRCHDINISGWWNLLWLVPGANFIFWFFLMAANGSPHQNNFGAMPDRPLTEQW